MTSSTSLENRPARTQLHVQASGGTLNVLDAAGQPLLTACRAVVTQSDGTRHSTEGAASQTETMPDGIVIRSPGSELLPALRWHVDGVDGDNTLRLWLEVENTTPRPIAIERLDALVAPTGYRQALAGELEVAQTGWQSWSAATPPVPLEVEAHTPPPPVIFPMLPPTEADRTLVPWMTVLHTPGGHSLLLGFTSARDQGGVIAIQPALAGHRCTASSYAEGIALHSGETLRSETLLLVFDRDDPSALDEYARELATTMEARPWPHVTTGWCSWYYFFTAVSEEDVLRNLETLSAERHRMPLEYVQLDDGYQAHIGDWLTLNEKFPSGMRFLTDAIRAQGYRPGLWLAPFLVSEHSEVYRQHPDWVIRDAHDQPINALHNWDSYNYALDTTHPEVQQWLRRVFRTIVDDWGYDYLKIDFIYAGALRGRRYDTNCTGVQAYRRGLELIREEAGDKFVLGCGAPFAPSVGLVDGMRIGPDTAPFWSDERGQHGSGPSLHNAVRSTLAHGWMQNRLWMNDPDCLMVRERDSQLTFAETQCWTTVVGLSGGMVLVSDDMSRLEPERAALIPLVLPPLGEAAVPLGPHIDAAPTRMKLDVERPWERWLVGALFNWTDGEKSLTFDPAAWGRPLGEPYHLFEFWTGRHYGPVTGRLEIGTVPAHGVRLLAVHEDKGRPQLVGSTLHLLGGAVEVAGETWDGNTLTVALSCPGEHVGELIAYAPAGYDFMGAGGDEVEQADGVLKVPVRLVDNATITLQFAQGGARA